MRNSLGIITTPRIDISDFVTSSAVSYENTEFEKVVDVIIKSIKSHKLLCIDLYSDSYSIFGITNVVYDNILIIFECGGLGANTGEKYAFYINTEDKEVTIQLVEM